MSASTPSPRRDGGESIHEDPLPKIGLVGIVGVMSPMIQNLLSMWLLMSLDTERRVIVVKSQNKTMADLLEMPGSIDPTFRSLAKLLVELELENAELLSIDGKTCSEMEFSEIQKRMVNLSGLFSFAFRNPGGNEWTKRVVVLKPETSVLNPTDFMRSLRFMETLDISDQASGGHFHGDQSSSSIVNDDSDKALYMAYPKPGEPDAAWIHQSPLEEGDRILSVNGNTTMLIEDPISAKKTVAAIYKSYPFLSIMVRTPPSRRRNENSRWSFRKGAVAAIGGTLVGTGTFTCLLWENLLTSSPHRDMILGQVPFSS